MARGGQHGDPHAVTDGDHVAVVHRYAVEGDRVGGVDVVRGAGRRGQGVAAGDVVVVDVGLEHVRDPHTGRCRRVQDAVDVALRVDHERDRAVVDQVAAVAEGGCVDREDVHHGGVSFRGQGRVPNVTGLPARCQPPVPPATDTASMPARASKSAAARLRLPEAQIR